MTHAEIVWLVQELLPALPDGWRLELYDNTVQLYCYDVDNPLYAFEGYLDYPMSAKELIEFIDEQYQNYDTRTTKNE